MMTNAQARQARLARVNPAGQATSSVGAGPFILVGALVGLAVLEVVFEGPEKTKHNPRRLTAEERQMQRALQREVEMEETPEKWAEARELGRRGFELTTRRERERERRMPELEALQKQATSWRPADLAAVEIERKEGLRYHRALQLAYEREAVRFKSEPYYAAGLIARAKIERILADIDEMK